MRCLPVLVACCLVALPCLGWCGEAYRSRSLAGRKVESPPKLDAVLDDPAWQAAPATDFSDTHLGTLVEDQTRFWIAYDDEALYAAFHFLDPKPEAIVARETRDNVGFDGEDRLRFYVNLFGTRQWDDFSTFAVNALGAHNTGIAGGRAAKQEWRGAWKSVAQRTGDGWIVELAIPWSILPRPSGDLGPRDITFNVERYQARTQISSRWSDLGRSGRMEWTGALTGVQVPPAAREDPLSLLWYGFTGYDDPRLAGRLGVDARYQFSPQTTGVVSLNPDFGNIESAVTTIDFSYSEILGNETRPFFQEGAGFFMDEDSSSRPFASQRIGGFDVGAKFFGQLNRDTKLGALATTEFGERTDAVVRLTRQFAQRTYAEFAGVTRREKGVDNTVLGGAAAHGTGDWSFSGNYFKSLDRAGEGESGGANLNWFAKNYWFSSGYGFVSPDYRARNGYTSFLDQRGGWFSTGYAADWRRGAISEFEVSLNGNRYWQYDGDLFRESVSIDVDVETRSLWRIGAGHTVGRFLDNRDRRTGLQASYPMNDRFRNASLGYSWGKQGGAAYDSLEAGANWRLFGKLQLGASTEWVRRLGTETQHVFRASYDFSREESLGGRLLTRNGRTSAFLSYRKSGYGGLEYFVILGDPAADGFRPRLVIKVVGAL